MRNLAFIDSIKSQSTWRLFGLGLITFGIYYAYYIKNTSDVINSGISAEKRLSKIFVNTILLVSYVSALLIVISPFSGKGHPVELVSDLIGSVNHILLIVWALKVKNRVNEYCELDSQTYMWLSGFWSFIFPSLYFNYKINGMAENMKHPNFIVTP